MKPKAVISAVDTLASKPAQWFVILLTAALVAAISWDDWQHRRKCEELQREQVEFLKINVTQINLSLDRAADALDRVARQSAKIKP